MKRALIYLRVSTPKQADAGESLEQQEEICRRYATDNGFEILRVFREPYSGRKEDRPILDEMFTYVEENAQIDTAIIRDIDRFTRGGSYSYELFKNRLLRSGVELIDTAGIIQPVRNTLEGTGFEYDWSRVSPSRLSESMVAEQAREEITKILTRCVSQEIRLVKAGYRTRPAPIGYQNQKIEGADGKKKTILVPNHAEAPWMQTMFSLRAEGALTDGKVCEQVNALGFCTRTQKRRDRITRARIGTTGGKPMTTNMLQKYVKNPIFCGVVMEKWTNHLPIRAQFPGLVTIETFNAANRGKIEIAEADDGALSVRHGAERKKRFLENPDYPYRHVIHCPKCKKPFVGSASRGKLGKRYPAYHCSRGDHYLRIPKDHIRAHRPRRPLRPTALRRRSRGRRLLRPAQASGPRSRRRSGRRIQEVRASRPLASRWLHPRTLRHPHHRHRPPHGAGLRAARRRARRRRDLPRRGLPLFAVRVDRLRRRRGRRALRSLAPDPLPLTQAPPQAVPSQPHEQPSRPERSETVRVLVEASEKSMQWTLAFLLGEDDGPNGRRYRVGFGADAEAWVTEDEIERFATVVVPPKPETLPMAEVYRLGVAQADEELGGEARDYDRVLFGVRGVLAELGLRLETLDLHDLFHHPLATCPVDMPVDELAATLDRVAMRHQDASWDEKIGSL